MNETRYTLHIFTRCSTKAGTVTNAPHGDDTYTLEGTEKYLRNYAEDMLANYEKENSPVGTIMTRTARNILEILDNADLSYYEQE